MLGGMPMTVTIRWEPGRRPVRGHVLSGTRPPRPFSGWLELLALLHEALGTTKEEEA